MKHLTLHITGMTCGHCENFVKSIIAEMPGTANVAVDHKTGLAQFDIDENLQHEEAIKAAINETQVYHTN